MPSAHFCAAPAASRVDPAQRFVAGVEQQRDVGFGQQRRIAPVGDGDDQRAAALGGFGAGHGERRRSARRDGDDRVARQIAERRDGPFRRLRIVFRGGVEIEMRAVGPGENDGDPPTIETKSARQLGGVLRRNEAGGARAEIDAAAAALPSIGQTQSRRADIAFRRRDAFDRPPIGREQRAGERWRRIGGHAASGVTPSLIARVPQFRAAHIACTSGRYLLYFSLVNGIPLV